jgi:hypothetical protein
MSIYGMIYEELESRIKHLYGYKKYKPAFDMLDREEIAGIELDGNTIWLEYYTYGQPTNKEISLLLEYLTKHKGYDYLYDLITDDVH